MRHTSPAVTRAGLSISSARRQRFRGRRDTQDGLDRIEDVPAEVIVGNTLTLETREVWHTPAHHLGFWSNKLRQKGDQAPPARDEPAAIAEQELATQTARPDPVYEEYQLDWRDQAIVVRWCAAWLGDDTGHLEIVTPNRAAHPISETGYKSHFIRPEHIEAEGGPLAYVESWLRAVDDGQPKQLSLF